MPDSSYPTDDSGQPMGPIKALIKSVSEAVAPKSVTQAKSRQSANEAAAEGQHSDETLSRWRANQSTDNDNGGQ